MFYHNLVKRGVGMKFKLKKWIIAASILSLVSIIPMAVPLFLKVDDASKEVLGNYFSIPFWCSVSLVMVLAAVNILCVAIRSAKFGDWKLKFLFPLFSMGLVAAGAFTIYTCVVNPLRDIPYLNDPNIIRLENVQFYYSNIGDSPTIQLDGRDQEGLRDTFDIDYKIYEQGQALYEQAYEMPGNNLIAADIEYLPYSKTILRMDIRIEESSDYA